MKPKGEKERFGPGWLNDELDRLEKAKGTYITSRFYVVETIPGKDVRQDDGHGGSEWHFEPARETRVSAFFNLKSQAQTFLDAHDPDPGNELKIREGKLYRKVVEEWYG